MRRFFVRDPWIQAIVFALLAAPLFLVRPGVAADAAGAAALQGSWKPVSALLGGDPTPAENLKTITLSFSDDLYEITVAGRGTTDRGTYTVQPRSRLSRMKMVGTSGPNEGRTFLAIYELSDQDTLRICYDLAGSRYPKAFASPYGTAYYLVTYKREPK